MKLDINTGWKNITALVVAGLGGVLALASQIEGMDLLWAPEWMAPLAALVALIAAYLTGNIPDQDDDGDVDMDDHRIAIGKVADAIREIKDQTKGLVLLVIPALALLGCGAAQAPTVDAVGERFGVHSTFEAAVDGGCAEGVGCDFGLIAPGNIVISAGTDVCVAGFCTPVSTVTTLSVLIEGDGDDPRTYGTVVSCIQSPALGVLGKLLMLSSGGRSALGIAGELIDGDTLCVEASAQ